MRVLLHIGFPKTATTFLQRKIFKDPALNFVGTELSMAEDRQKAEEFLRIVLSVTDCEEILYAQVRELNKKRAQNIINANKVNILSNERLSAEWCLSDRSLTQVRLRELFPDARVLLFFRNPFDILRSHYLQISKGFGTKNYSFSFSDFIDASLDIFFYSEKKDFLQNRRNPSIHGLGNILSRLQYDVFADHCLNIYGKKNVEFFTYENFFNGPDYERLMDLIYEGKERPEHDLTPRENQAHSFFEYQYSQCAGKSGLQYYMKYLYAVLMRSPLKKLSPPVDLQFTSAQEAALLEIFEPMIDRTAAITEIDFAAQGYPVNENQLMRSSVA
jgi:hypothetical protein